MSEGKEYISRPDEMGNIHISEEVLAVIAAAAAREVDGVSSLAGGLSGDLAELVNGKKLSRGIHIQVNDEAVTIRVAILVKYGYAIPDVGRAVQDSVMSAVENTTGLKVDNVNVHVAGVAFPR